MNKNYDGISIKSYDSLKSSSENVRLRINMINEALMDYISLAESSLENWKGDTADEFEKRIKSIRSPLDNTVANILECMNDLNEIAEIYDKSRNRKKSGVDGLPTDLIY